MGQYFTFAKTAIKNLFSKPATTSYPFEPAVYPERSRGHVEIDVDLCILCGMCMRSCPPGAIEVKRADSVWTINRFDCVQCGYCVEKCPKKCLSIVPGYQEPGAEKYICEFKVPVKPAPAKPAAAKPAAAKPAAPAADAPKAEAPKADAPKAEA